MLAGLSVLEAAAIIMPPARWPPGEGFGVQTTKLPLL